MKKCLLSFGLFFMVGIGFSQYYFNKATKFGPNAYYSSVSESPYDAAASGITIEAWIYLEAIDVDMMIVGKNFQTGYAFGLRSNSATDAILRFNMGGAFVNSTGTVSLNQWTHVAVSYDNVGTVKFYINGTLTPNSFGSLAGAIPNNSDLCYIGADLFGGNPSFFLRGQMDELRIWDGVRTDSEIANSRFIPLGVDNTTGNAYKQRHAFRMNMNSATDTLFSDCWPHRPMIPHNITLVDFTNQPTTYVDYNNHLTFDGSSGMKIESNLATSQLTPGKSMTVEAWVRMEVGAPGSFMNIFNQSANTDEYPWGIYANNLGEIFFDINAGASTSVSGGNISDLRWHHIAGTCDDVAGKIKLYVDGTLIDSASFVPGAGSIAQTTYPWYAGTIGASSFATNKFKGGIDELRLWKNTVRTQAEIKKYMFIGLDNQVSDPDISNLFVFSLDGVTRQTNISVLNTLPVLYGSLSEGTPLFSSSKINNNDMPTSPLLRLDASNYPDEFNMSFVGRQIVDMGTTLDTISISGMNSGNLASIEVAVLLNHVYNSDIEVMLYSPAGDSVMLVDANATGCNGNDLMTIFSATADFTYSNTCDPSTNLTPASPNIKPMHGFSSVMSGNPDGNWRIRVSDKAAGLDGYFSGWGLRLRGDASISEPQASTFNTYNFPNPSSELTTIYFELPKGDDARISIYDQSGKLVQQHMVNNAQQGSNNYVIDVSSLSAGMYYYQITSGMYQGNNKIIVNK